MRLINFDLETTLISFSDTGDNLILTAPATKKIRVYGLFLASDGDSTLVFKDNSSPITTLWPATRVLADGEFNLELVGHSWFDIPEGKQFIINQTGTAIITGRVYYKGMYP